MAGALIPLPVESKTMLVPMPGKDGWRTCLQRVRSWAGAADRRASRPIVAVLAARAVGLSALLSLACLSPGTTSYSDEVRRALGGMRSTQPRLSGFAFAPCASSKDLFPVARCGPTRSGKASGLGRLAVDLRQRLRGKPTRDELHAAAILSLASSPRQESALQSASTFLREAAAFDASIEHRALIYSDLAVAHLLLGELLQSPVEVAAALEWALHALQLSPELPEALFNRQLALHLLGIETLPEPSGDPWMDEISARLGSPSGVSTVSSVARAEETSRCLPSRELRRLFDTWSKDQSSGGWGDLEAQRPCLAARDDRFFDALLAAAGSEPREVAHAWQVYRAAAFALYDFDLDVAGEHLSALRLLDPPEALRLSGRWLEATVAYQRTAYDSALDILEPLAEEAVRNSFFELAAQSRRLAALIDQVRGDYDTALLRLQRALEEARRSGSAASEAAVLALIVEQQELVGREDEAWRSIIAALRSLNPKTQQMPSILCLQSAARLAQARGFSRVAQLIHGRAVSLADEVGPVPQISTLKARGELLAALGLVDLARRDLASSRRLLEDASSGPGVREVLEADLLLLEGQIAEEASARRAALAQALERFAATEYDRRIITAQLALARITREQGDPDIATATLVEAFGKLGELVAKASGWAEATALVAAARPVVDELLGLQLERHAHREVLETLTAFFGLRSGAGSRAAAGSLPGQRLTYFVRDREIAILLETAGEVTLGRSTTDRQRLTELRDRFLIQVRSGAPEARLRATAQPLARLLIAPIAEHLRVGEPLVIVADDVLAGLPFVLLPWGEAGDLLIDEFAVSYSTDLGPIAEPPRPGTLLVVGSTATEPGLLPLLSPREEALQLAEIYPSVRPLVGAAASPAQVERALAASPEAAHFAGHFVVNTRSPGRSYLVLAEGEDRSGRLTLEDLLAIADGNLRWLYLSGCETGRGLPPAPHGVFSLAQVFKGAGIERTILSLWPLEDRIGGEMAVAFHRLLASGLPAVEALRNAQLEHRSESPSRWAPLAIYY